MARTVLLSTLESDVRQMGDWENATDRVPQALVYRALNQAITETWLEIVRAGGQHKVTTTATANTTSGTRAYSLASDFLWMLAVLVTADGVERELTRVDMLHSSDFTDSGGGIGVPQFFQLVGDNLEFVPTPDGAYPYRYRYVQGPTSLASASDPWDGIIGFEQHAVCLATKMIATRQKEWDLVNSMRADIQGHATRIFDTVKRRNPLPPTVTDVRSLERRNTMKAWRR